MVHEPTSYQCSNNEMIGESEDERMFALWYPQMGGYVGKAVALITKHRGGMPEGYIPCIDILVWHDGDFPFGSKENPRRLHLCDPQQFIDFGEQLQELNK